MGEMGKLRGWRQLVRQIAMRDCQYPAEREMSHLRDNAFYLSNFGDTFV